MPASVVQPTDLSAGSRFSRAHSRSQPASPHRTEGALGEQAVGTALVAAFEPEQPVDTLDGLVLRYDQAVDIALKLNDGFRREDLFKVGA